MMKKYRIDLSKGINIELDKALHDGGFVSVADGVDVRSGMAKPFKSYLYVKDASSDDKCIFSYRNKIYTSSDYRHYCVETINGQDRLYYSSYGGVAGKIIDGVEVELGLNPPDSLPLVNSLPDSSIRASATQSTSGGNHVTGTNRSYRVAVETKDGVQVPSQPVVVIFSNSTSISTHSATVTWNSVEGAVKYWVFAGSSGSEKLVAQTGVAQLSVTDDGSSWTYGEPASNYDDATAYTYFYTFLRDVLGAVDESGPSQPSLTVSSANRRQVIFDFASDGFFDNDSLVTISSGITTESTVESNLTTTISSTIVNTVMRVTSFTLDTDIGAEDGDKVFFVSNYLPDINLPNYYTIRTGVNSQDIIIEDVVLDVDGTKLSDGMSIGLCKTFFEWDNGNETSISDDDVVRVIGDYNEFTDDIFRTKIETPSGAGKTKISIPKYTVTSTSVTISSISYVPKNNYIKYRNLYRTTPSGGYGLVSQVPIWDSEFYDTVAVQNLGASPSSYYTEQGNYGQTVTVVATKPPTGLDCLVSHYGMKFAIDGNMVRWTPIGYPDYWPEAFSITFPFKPVALASLGSLIVLCVDSIYRIDGTEPTRLALNDLYAKDGCIAPLSVQTSTDAGILYLSRRGVMSFNGMSAECITDDKVPSEFWSSPSYDSVVRWGLLPTMASRNYALATRNDGVLGTITVANEQSINHAGNGVIMDIKSFLHNGKYFIYWTNDTGNYGIHTVVCIDLKASGRPITTLPYRLTAAHVSETGKVLAIMNDTRTSPYISFGGDFLIAEPNGW